MLSQIKNSDISLETVKLLELILERWISIFKWWLDTAPWSLPLREEAKSLYILSTFQHSFMWVY